MKIRTSFVSNSSSSSFCIITSKLKKIEREKLITFLHDIMMDEFSRVDYHVGKEAIWGMYNDSIDMMEELEKFEKKNKIELYYEKGDEIAL